VLLSLIANATMGFLKLVSKIVQHVPQNVLHANQIRIIVSHVVATGRMLLHVLVRKEHLKTTKGKLIVQFAPSSARNAPL
jgi:hypothetical protein